jgi:cell division protein FtsI (penicillin-binding protein 3)
MKKLRHQVLSRQNKQFVYLKRHISPAVAENVMKLELPGVSLQREYKRFYPAGEVTAHVVGLTNVDDKGQEGLELAYDEWLRGQPGSQRVIKDRLGRVIKHVEQIRAPKAGKDLSLSIDRRIQYLAYRELKRAVIKHKARSGSAVVMDARSGEVIAMVNQPAYNPNNRRAGVSSHYRNRAVTDVFEPGSTIKPFTVAAALNSGRFSSRSKIDTAPGFYKVGNSTVKDTRNYGRIDLTTLIKKSSNVGASKLALAIKPETLWKVHSQMGFGETTNSGFPGEASGFLTDAQQWRKIERATLAFGYGMSVTALQLARAYSVIANDGKLQSVSLIRQDEFKDSRQVMKPAIARQLRAMLKQVVSEGGTGTRAAIAGYHVAGKTGTVKKVTRGGYSEDRYTSVFAGMVPATQPRLVMVVTIDEPNNGVYYGGEVAAPVFAEVMSNALQLMDIAPDNLSRKSVHLATLGNNVSDNKVMEERP